MSFIFLYCVHLALYFLGTICGIFLGYLFGRQVERVEWNKLIERGVLREPGQK